MAEVARVGARVEELLEILRSEGSETTGPAAEELVRILLGLYGEGLAHVMTVVDEQGDAGAQVMAKLLADPLVESLLILHDLHPLDVDTRIQQALDKVRPYLGSHAGGVQYLGVDADGVAQLRLQGSCDGCPSSTLTVELAIKGAILEAAPEVSEVQVEGVTAPTTAEPKLLQIGRRPPGTEAAGTETAGAEAAGGAGDIGASSEPTWVSLPDMGPPTGKPLTTMAAGVPILIASVRGTLYAYRDACAACGSSLGEGTVVAERLECAQCGAAYDVRSAGKRLEGPRSQGGNAQPGRADHLDPLPLLTDSQGVRIAVPAQQEAIGS
ncbi:MAG TPA: NifU family protein [Streptosporangiaceae bacterium]|nr:NifU family protein [Streptosporangiaceae bacterium]